MKKIIFFGFFMVLSCLPVLSYVGTEAEGKAFLDNFIELSNQFDKKVTSLYKDDALIRVKMTKPDGTVENIQMTGEKYKELTIKALPFAKKRGDTTDFSNITYAVQGEKIIIKADRYSTDKCYTDKGYYIVIEKVKDTFLIVEEYSEMQVVSNCKEVNSIALDEFMEMTKKSMGAQLPAMIDEQTRLDEVNVIDKVLQFKYILIKSEKEKIDPEEFSKIMKPVLIKQSCMDPSLRMLIDQGASISFSYKDKNSDLVKEIVIARDSCLSKI
jgi:hypothetical protein